MKNKGLYFLLETILPVILLIYLSVNTTYFFFFTPYTGIDLNSSGVVNDLEVAPVDNEAIRADDIIYRINGKLYENYDSNLAAPPIWRGYKPGETISVTILKDGKEQEKSYTLPTQILPQITNRFLSQWFMPYLFFVAGLMGLLFLRPRNSQRNLFILFNFLIAIWFSASNLSAKHEIGAQYVLRAAFWLWLPVAWHFHWEFPRPLKKLPGWVLPALYGVCILLALAQVSQMLSSNTYLLSFLLAILGSGGLLTAHVILQPDFRHLAKQTRSLFFFLLIPIGAAVVLNFIFYKQGAYYLPLAFLSISALPGFYFFILFFQNNLMSDQRTRRLYRLYTWITLAGVLLGVIYALANPIFPNLGVLFANYFILILIGLSLVNFAPLLILPALGNPQQPGDEDARLQIRANRVASGLFFIFLMLLLGSAVGSSIQLAFSAPFNLIASPVVALVIGMASMQWYAPFQRWFDTRVLNIPIQPERLLETYSERILTSLDQNTLNNLFLQEVLPSWLVRQFTLLQLEGEDLQPLIILGVEPQQLPQHLDSAVDWARLSLPLSLGGKPAGLMLFGRRDPDDFYAANEMAVLQQIANLTALALANIKQSSALQELYQTDIERQETERTTLAAELHDDVLQHMALLSNQLADLQPSPELLETYQYTANRIREITSGLRTPLLAFGLASALEGLVDNAQDRELKDLSVVFDMTENDVRLDERLELHLFRLAQQALDNALQHAQASQIRLGGSISPSNVTLSISDNGVGFASVEKLDITSLLANKHFGVAGMFERAALIGAEIAILSHPGQGCQVNVRWAAK